MGFIVKSILIFFVAFSVFSYFVTFKSDAYADLDSLCLYIAEDNKKRLRKTLKSTHLKIRNLFKEMSCNNMSLLQFAIHRKAENVGIFMVKKIPVSSLRKSNILQWAEDNNHHESAVYQTLLARLDG